MKKEIVRSAGAPVSRNPISQATKFGNLVFVSGQNPSDPVTGKMIEGDVRAMMKRTFDNLKAILEAAGTSMDNVLKITCYVSDRQYHSLLNEVWLEYFPDNWPARKTVQQIQGRTPIEIDAIACIPDE